MDSELFLEKIRDYLSVDDVRTVQAAYELANTAHANQFRKSGEPYIIHPVATAAILAEYHLDATTLAAAILHDVPEDTSVTLAQIRTSFGKEVAGLVDGVTKLSRVRLKKNWLPSFTAQQTATSNETFETFDRHVETLRKMFLAMSHDIRVILIKLADRLHNMSTISSLASEKQQRIAQETLEVYAPLANRLGIGQIKGRLEDLAFPIALPDEFRRVRQLVETEFPRRQRYSERIRREILSRLAVMGLRAEAHARAKHMYSLWKKLKRYDFDLSKIYDLVAVRILVPTVEDCYRVLGMIHQQWKPLPGRIKDYIAMPKPNGYQSLHTTVFALGGKISEIQIRTPEMHHWAEFGIAAHWAYKENYAPVGIKQPLPKQKLAWIQELAKLEEVLRDPTEWRKGLALDFFEDRIFVFTPNGDVLDLPSGATPIDFAFQVHSDLGRRCAGAKVNGKMVPLSHPLENGDIVDILINKKTEPKRDWLQFAKTSRARALIKRTLNIPTEA